MKQKVITFLTISFPFLITLVLWRLSCPFINPAGILAIIPIFYCSFIRPVPYFTVYALLFCFLLDYKFGTVLIWTIFYCIYYVVINIQTFIDLSHTNKNGLFAFMTFLAPVILFIMLHHIGWTSIITSILTFSVLCAMYIPTTFLIKAVKND